MNLLAPQPPPRASDAAPVWPLVIAEAKERLSGPVVPLLLADMAQRDQDGRAKYERPLTADNGRDHLVDSYQESLDKTVYLRAELEEGDPGGYAGAEYPLELASALRLREALARREASLEAVRGALVAQGFPSFDNHTAEAFREIRLGDHLGMDSLAVVEAVMAVDEALDVDLADEGLRAVMTVGDLARAAERALAEKARRA